MSYRYKIEVFTVLVIIFACTFRAQGQFTSIHHEQNEAYKQFGELSENQWDSINGKTHGEPLVQNKANCTLDYSVYGWNPYWTGTAYNNYNYNLLSTFCYFSYELDPSTGSYSTIHSWKTTNSINLAQAAGCKVELCVTNFGSSNNNIFLTNPTAEQRLIDSLISLLNYRNATGINIDFEGVSASNRPDLTNFMTMLSTQVKAAISGATITMATYSVDWSNVFDLPALNNVVDQFIIMGYGYYYGGSTTAGPSDPLYSGTIWSAYNLAKSMDYYLAGGVTPSKLLIGLPYYGYEWETVSGAVPASTTGNFSSARQYNYIRANASGNYGNGQFDTQSKTAYYAYQTGGNWREAFVDNVESYSDRYDMVKQLNIGGIGIWALGYDDGYTELWDLIEQKFTDCAITPCSDTIYDTGGALGEYYDDENYSFTIAPTGASFLKINFLEFDVENGFDSLWVYDGPSTSSALIGGYSGSVLPSQITSSGNSLTIRFHSDGATRANGWEIVYECGTDTIPPTTHISAPPMPYVTTDFTSNFTDADNTNGTGIMHQFFTVDDFNAVEWLSNTNNGFFNDDFDASINPNWIDSSGTWSISTNYLTQTDETNSNTNLFAPFNQNLANKFLYHYKARISGVGADKRAGFHYMCDDASQVNRGNSYFVWFRQDQGKLQFYKVVNDTYTLVKDVVYTFNANQWYDYKIVYDISTGITEVYVDDQFIDSWTDATPYTLGNYVSFRSGNCVYDVDELSIYHDRTNSAIITVGSAVTNDIRYENPTPTTPSGRILSIVIDTAHNISIIDTAFVNVNFETSTAGITNYTASQTRAYPNPFYDNITLSLPDNSERKIMIYNTVGQIIYNETLLPENKMIKLDFTNYNLETGMYLLQISDNKQTETIRLIRN